MPFLDFLRLPFSKQPANQPAGPGAPGREIGVSGLGISHGVIEAEMHRALQNRDQRMKIWAEMAQNESVIHAALFAIEMTMRAVEWRVEAASDDAADVEAAEFLESCMDDMSHSWADWISEWLSMLTYGFMPFEVVYKRRLGPDQKDSSRRSKFTDGKLGWRKFAPRSQASIAEWLIDEGGGLQGIKQTDPNTDQEHIIPIQKMLLFRTTSRLNNPEGESILRGAYKSWFYKKHLEKIEAIGIERDLAGYPVVRIPKTAIDNPTFRVAYEQMVRDIRRDEQEGVVLPSDRDEQGHLFYELELLKGAGGKQTDTTRVIMRHNAQMTMSVLADWLIMGHSAVGTEALATIKVDQYMMALGGWMGMGEDTLNRFAVPKLFRLNGANLEKLPQIRAGDVANQKAQDLMLAVKDLAQAGAEIFPDLETENYLRRALKIPERTEDEELIEPKPVTPRQPVPRDEEEAEEEE